MSRGKDLFIKGFPADLLKRLKEQAGREERTLKMTVIRAIREYLEKREEG